MCNVVTPIYRSRRDPRIRGISRCNDTKSMLVSCYLSDSTSIRNRSNRSKFIPLFSAETVVPATRVAGDIFLRAATLLRLGQHRVSTAMFSIGCSIEQIRARFFIANHRESPRPRHAEYQPFCPVRDRYAFISAARSPLRS